MIPAPWIFAISAGDKVTIGPFPVMVATSSCHQNKIGYWFVSFEGIGDVLVDFFRLDGSKPWSTVSN